MPHKHIKPRESKDKFWEGSGGMTFYITNKNIDHRYPLLMRHYEYDHYFDKLTGNDTFVINIDTI